MLIKEQPEKFIQAVNDLYDKGKAQVNNFKITAKNIIGKNLDDVDPSKEKLTHDPKKESTDWIMLTSIQNSENDIYNYYGTMPDDDDASGNTSGDIKHLMKNLLGYTDVKQTENDKNTAIATLVQNINQDVGKGYSIILGIDVKLLDNTYDDGGHAVTLLTPITSKTQNGVTTYSFDVQTWGTRKTVKASGDDLKNYLKDYTSGKK